MTAIRALSAAGLLLLSASSASAQDADGTPPDRGSAAAGTAPAPVQPGIRVAPPKLDPKLLIDVFKALSKPRPPAPAPVPEAAAPVVVAAPAPVPPSPAAAAPAPPKPAPAAAPAPTPVVVPRDVKPAPSPPRPRPASPVAPVVAEPPSPPVAEPTEPAAPAPEPPIAVSQAPETPAPSRTPAEPPSNFLVAGTLLPLVGLIAALGGAIAAGLSFNRARRIARTRAALALSPRLDLSLGEFSVGGMALAGPSVAIRARLDPPEARSG